MNRPHLKHVIHTVLAGKDFAAKECNWMRRHFSEVAKLEAQMQTSGKDLKNLSDSEMQALAELFMQMLVKELQRAESLGEFTVGPNRRAP